MIIANKLREENRIEYLLYMWQVEDILRQYDCDISQLEAHYLSQFELDDALRQETIEWYSHLCRMMLEEGVRVKGHLQINRNTLNGLEELHNELLKSDKFPYYKQMYYKVLPHIVQLRSKGATAEESELYNCFEALYGLLLLRLQHSEISEGTKLACADISTMLGQLGDYFKQWCLGNLTFE